MRTREHGAPPRSPGGTGASWKGGNPWRDRGSLCVCDEPGRLALFEPSDSQCPAHFFTVGLRHRLLLRVLALALLGLVLEQVALPGARTHELSGLGDPDPLGETLSGLELRHCWTQSPWRSWRCPAGWARGS